PLPGRRGVPTVGPSDRVERGEEPAAVGGPARATHGSARAGPRPGGRGPVPRGRGPGARGTGGAARGRRASLGAGAAGRHVPVPARALGGRDGPSPGDPAGNRQVAALARPRATA